MPPPPSSRAASMLSVGPTIAKFLAENKLIEGQPDFARGVDATLLADAKK